MLGIKNIIFDLGGVILNLDNRLTEVAFLNLGVKISGNISAMDSPLLFLKNMKSDESTTGGSSTRSGN